MEVATSPSSNLPDHLTCSRVTEVRVLIFKPKFSNSPQTGEFCFVASRQPLITPETEESTSWILEPPLEAPPFIYSPPVLVGALIGLRQNVAEKCIDLLHRAVFPETFPLEEVIKAPFIAEFASSGNPPERLNYFDPKANYSRIIFFFSVSESTGCWKLVERLPDPTSRDVTSRLPRHEVLVNQAFFSKLQQWTLPICFSDQQTPCGHLDAKTATHLIWFRKIILSCYLDHLFASLPDIPLVQQWKFQPSSRPSILDRLHLSHHQCPWVLYTHGPNSRAHLDLIRQFLNLDSPHLDISSSETTSASPVVVSVTLSSLNGRVNSLKNCLFLDQIRSHLPSHFRGWCTNLDTYFSTCVTTLQRLNKPEFSFMNNPEFLKLLEREISGVETWLAPLIGTLSLRRLRSTNALDWAPSFVTFLSNSAQVGVVLQCDACSFFSVVKRSICGFHSKSNSTCPALHWRCTFDNCRHMNSISSALFDCYPCLFDKNVTFPPFPRSSS